MQPEASCFDQPVAPDAGTPISFRPLGALADPGLAPVYWLARCVFKLAAQPSVASLAIAADRHYEVFLNQTRVATCRNYFSGDRYLWLQRHAGPDLTAAAAANDNIIEVLVRSDPRAHKNHIPFHPMLWCHLHLETPAGTVDVATGADWEVAVVAGWRTLRAYQLTIAYEKLTIPPADRRGVRGIPNDLEYRRPAPLDRRQLPPIYEWTDKPKRVDIHRPAAVVAAGNWTGAADSICFNLHDLFGAGATGGAGVVLHTEFNAPRDQDLWIAVSGFCDGAVELNHVQICARNNLPGPDLMRQKNFLAPPCRCRVRQGLNELAVRFGDDHRRFLDWQARFAQEPLAAGLWFRLQIQGMPAADWRWQNGTGRAVKPVPCQGNLEDILGAKAASMPLPALTVGSTPAEFTLCGLRAGEKQFILLDFNGIKKGQLSFTIQADAPGRIYLAYGFLADQGSVDCGRNGKKAVDIIEVPAGSSEYEAFEDRTFVYLDMAFENFNGTLSIAGIALAERVFLDERRADCRSPDPLLPAVWRAALRTAQICCDEIYMDNSEREHCQWLCSAPPNIAAGYYAFGGEMPKTAKVLLEYALHQRPDGEIQGFAPGSWGDRPMYQCHMGLYVRAVWRDYHYRGDPKLLRRLMPHLHRLQAFWETRRNSQGLLENIETVWVDWGQHIYSYAPGGIPGAQGAGGVLTAMNAYYLGALRMCAELARALGEDRPAERYDAMADETAAAMARLLFDRDKILFRDGLNNPAAEKNYSQAANAVAALYGALPPAERPATLRAAFETAQPWAEIIPASPHFGLLAGEALFEAGLDSLAYAWIGRHAHMLQSPAGTIWETWSPHVAHCQGIGSAIAYHLARYHAGIYPARPGFAAIGVRPQACGQAWLRMQLHTACGAIGAAWKRTPRGFDYELTLPPALQDRPLEIDPAVNLTIAHQR